MIAVYGGTGFIGSEFCKKYDSYVVPRDSVDLPNPESITSILYLISTVDNYNIFTDPYLDINTNLIHLIKILEYVKNNCAHAEITFVSSWFVYGETELPVKENYCCNPKGFYSITKYAAEKLLASYCDTFDLKFKIVRLANVVGNGDKKVSKKKNALQYLISELSLNNPIKLYDDGNFYRDIIHVEDVVEGLKFIIDKGQTGEIYNLGSGIPIRFGVLIDYAKKILGSTSEIGTMEPTKFHSIVQVKSMYLDTTKIKSLGFKPKIDVLKIVKSLCDNV